MLGQLHADGLAIVLSTHDLNGMAAHLSTLLCLNVRVAGRGSPREVLTPAILEQVYGAPMDVLEHAGRLARDVLEHEDPQCSGASQPSSFGGFQSAPTVLDPATHGPSSGCGNLQCFSFSWMP